MVYVRVYLRVYYKNIYSLNSRYEEFTFVDAPSPKTCMEYFSCQSDCITASRTRATLD